MERERKNRPSQSGSEETRRSSSTKRETARTTGTRTTRQRGERPSNDKRKKQQKERALLILIVVVVLLVISLIIGGLTRKNGYSAYVDDTYIGTMKKEDITTEDLINTVTAKIKEERGTEIQINETITLEPIHIKNEEVITLDSIVAKVKNQVTYKVKAAAIYVDGAAAVLLDNKEQADTLLNGIIEEYVGDNSNITESGFVQNVEVKEEFVDSEQIITQEEALKKLTQATPTQKTYTVSSGDTLFTIAVNAGMSVDEIMQINPGITTSIQPGQKINITVSTPFLSVKTVENVVYTEREPKTVEYQQDNTQPSSYSRVIQQGRDGQKEVTVQIIRINGFEDDQKVIDTKITQEPVTEIIAVGTQ